LDNLAQIWETIKDAVTAFGWVKGTFTLFFWIAHYWLYRLYSGRLADRQAQINMLAAENREYRERYLAILDRHFGLPTDQHTSEDTARGRLAQTQAKLMPPKETPAEKTPQRPTESKKGSAKPQGTKKADKKA
jgi:hypothetical protein